MTVIDTSAGAVFIALLMSSILFGVTCTQAVHFFQRRRSDYWFTVLVVVVLLLLDISLMVLAAYGSYVYIIKAIGDLTVLLRVPRTMTAIIMVSLSSVFLVRGFFVYRIWLLSNRSRIVLMFNCILLFGSYGLGLYAGTKILPIRFTLELANLSWEIYSILCPGIIADAWIASTLCYYLFRSRNEFAKTNSLVNTLAAYAINTGLLTVFWDICMIVSYAKANHTLLFLIFFLSISKRESQFNYLGLSTNLIQAKLTKYFHVYSAVYINALLASLNSRPARRARHAGFPAYQLSQTRRFGRSEAGTANLQDSELETGGETIDIRLPASTDFADRNSDISLPVERK